jgi:putative holliday junction resolvase
MRHLGIDFGTKKVGLALSDEAATMGFPHAVLQNDGKLLDTILSLIQAQDVRQIVIGESLNAKGAENEVAKEARAFGERLFTASGVPVDYEMEAFSTQEARRDFEGNRTNTVDVDASAAALVLTSYLSRLHER